jgi:hypothetical protein
VVATAFKIEVIGDRVAFTFLPIHRMHGEKVEEGRAWLEKLASAVTGRKMTVSAAQAEQNQAPASAASPAMAAPAAPVDLKTSVMSDAAVQAMLDVFPAEIEDVEEI